MVKIKIHYLTFDQKPLKSEVYYMEIFHKEMDVLLSEFYGVCVVSVHFLPFIKVESLRLYKTSLTPPETWVCLLVFMLLFDFTVF